MKNKGNRQSDNLYDLASMAKSCGFMLGDKGYDMLEGELGSVKSSV